MNSVLGSAADWLCVSKPLNCSEPQFLHLQNGGVTPNFVGKVNDKKKEVEAHSQPSGLMSLMNKCEGSSRKLSELLCPGEWVEGPISSSTHTDTHARAHTHACTHVHTHTCTHAHTHAHTQSDHTFPPSNSYPSHPTRRAHSFTGGTTEVCDLTLRERGTTSKPTSFPTCSLRASISQGDRSTHPVPHP